MISGYSNFSSETPASTLEMEKYHRLNSIFSKNKYGYSTRIMGDFELFLDALLNEKFLPESTAYYNDELTGFELEDMENGLVGDFAPSDVQQLNHDTAEHSHEPFKALQWPDRVGTNYPKSDDLSCYKILPKKN